VWQWSESRLQRHSVFSQKRHLEKVWQLDPSMRFLAASIVRVKVDAAVMNTQSIDGESNVLEEVLVPQCGDLMKFNADDPELRKFFKRRLQ